MAQVEFTLQVDNFSLCEAEIEARIITALNAIGQYVEGQAKSRCPVGQYDDGRVGGTLRASISNKVNASEKQVGIGTDVEYAQFVEKGTSRQTAQPYLTPSVEQNTSSITAIVTQTFGGM